MGPSYCLAVPQDFFFFSSQKRIAFCMVTPLHPEGQQWEKCSHSWNTIVLRFPHKLVGHLSMTLAAPPPPRMDGKRSVLLLSTEVLLNKS